MVKRRSGCWVSLLPHSRRTRSFNTSGFTAETSSFDVPNSSGDIESMEDMSVNSVNGHTAGGGSKESCLTIDQRLKILYPMVDESQTALPRSWSTKDKYNYIGLSQNNLRVQYKGHGKTHKDASSVRATHSIPAACGIYYFEIKIISKGRDGYMGIGLSAQGVNMNRLPGWDKHSYGYHGDDGHSFCSSGTGQAYGPTFTTGDIIGCGVNLVDASCFYTKNGHHLGIAFTDLPSHLYPTVGLQTPGEVVDVNFGQDPFLFDIEGEMLEMRSRVHVQIRSFPWPNQEYGDRQQVLNRLVLGYLVHHGYSDSAMAFTKDTGQTVVESTDSMRQRQTIRKLVLSGRMSDALSNTKRLYPGLLQLNPSLRFILMVRQFIEMVAGCDSIEQTSPSFTTMKNTNGILISTNGSKQISLNGASQIVDTIESAAAEPSDMSADFEQHADVHMEQNGKIEDVTNLEKCDKSNGASTLYPGVITSSGLPPPSVSSNPDRYENLINFGKKLQVMLKELESLRGKCESEKLLLQNAFSLLAYSDPWTSPVGWQFLPSERERVASAVNSEIVAVIGLLPTSPALEVVLGHTQQIATVMAANDLGVSACVDLADFIR